MTTSASPAPHLLVLLFTVAPALTGAAFFHFHLAGTLWVMIYAGSMAVLSAMACRVEWSAAQEKGTDPTRTYYPMCLLQFLAHSLAVTGIATFRYKHSLYLFVLDDQAFHAWPSMEFMNVKEWIVLSTWQTILWAYATLYIVTVWSYATAVLDSRSADYEQLPPHEEKPK